MRKLSFVVVFLLLQLNVFAQSVELGVGYDLAQEILQWEELNPTYKVESDRYLKTMRLIAIKIPSPGVGPFGL